MSKVLSEMISKMTCSTCLLNIYELYIVGQNKLTTYIVLKGRLLLEFI